MVNTVLVPTVGVTLIGDFVSIALYGAVSMQTYNYFQTYGNKDGWGLQSLVTFLWLLETTHVFLICATMFRWVILDVGDPVALGQTQAYDAVVLGITALIIFTVQCFYARRLWILTKKSILLASVVVIIACCHFGLQMAVMAEIIKLPEFDKFHGSFIIQRYLGAFVLIAADDIIIAIAMIYLLNHRRTGVKSTNSLVTRIITYSVTTGILTSVVQILVLVTYITMPNNLVYLTFFQFINNLYANSLLAILNARKSLREMRPTLNVGNSFQLSALHTKNSENTTMQESRSNVAKMQVPWAAGVEVTTETHVEV